MLKYGRILRPGNTLIVPGLFFLLLAMTPGAAAELAGDVNSDGKIDLTEAVYALQVVSGQKIIAPEQCSGAPPFTGTPANYTNALGMSFSLIPAGSFSMGSPTGEAGQDTDETLHPVTVSQPFYMMTTEVTQGQWLAVTGSNPARYQECGSDCPVEMVAWDDIQNFIVALNQKTCQSYRLPSEGEWEYAARAGSATAFTNEGVIQADPWSCNFEPSLDLMGWYCENSEAFYSGCYDLSDWDGPDCAGPQPVAIKAANAWGLYDMHGNVWEWVQDWYGIYPSTAVTDPAGPASGLDRVMRGGGWDYPAASLRSANRAWDNPGFRYDDIGFRLIFVPGD